MKYGLPPEYMETIRSILAADPAIEQAILYGSRATGTYKKASDIDLAIQGAHFGLFQAASLKALLEEETTIPYFFDIVAYQSIQSADLKQHIDQHGIIIYRKGE